MKAAAASAAASARLPSLTIPHLNLLASWSDTSSSRIPSLVPCTSPFLLPLLPLREPAAASPAACERRLVAASLHLHLAAAPARAAVHATIPFVFAILLCPVSALLPPRLLLPPRTPAFPKVRHGAG